MDRYPRTPSIPERPSHRTKNRHRPVPGATICDRCERPGAEFRWISASQPAAAKRSELKLCRICTESFLDFVGQSVAGPTLLDEAPAPDRSVPPWITPMTSEKTPAG
jgi:hypothetical protein